MSFQFEEVRKSRTTPNTCETRSHNRLPMLSCSSDESNQRYTCTEVNKKVLNIVHNIVDMHT